MKKIIFKWNALEKVNIYSENYSNYYEELYQDSWLWNENQIIEWYREEWKRRQSSIFKTIANHLQNEIITFPNNEALIRWRTKIIIVKFFDDGDLRVVEDLDIR